MITVSIVIPTYNRSTLVLNAIESALQQTFKDYEIIVVDDGSTDDTAQKLAPYADRIRYFYQDNQGVSGALNKGIELACGQWVAILASDDLWLPHKLETQLNAIKKMGSEFGACFTNCSFVGDPEGTLSAFEKAGVECHSDIEPLEEPQQHLVSRNPILYAQSMLVLRSLLQTIQGFDRQLLVGEDTDMLFRLAFHTRFCILREPLVKVDRTPTRPRLTDLYKSPDDLIFACILSRYDKWLRLPEFTDQKIRGILQEQMQGLYYTWAIANLYRHDVPGAIGKIRLAEKNGHSFTRITFTLLFRATRKFCTSLNPWKGKLQGEY